MKSVYFRKHGDLDEIEYGDRMKPNIAPDEVLIKTEFAGLNHLDLFVLEGWQGLKLPLPHIMGSDGAGIITNLGENVKNFEIGDRVTLNPGISCGICPQCLTGHQNFCRSFNIKGETLPGTFAEYFNAPAINLLKIPSHIESKVAAAAPLNFLTAYRMVVTLGNVENGDIVLIQGAGGGVASAAIQIAKVFGATVIATTSTPEKVTKAQEIGADYVFNYRLEEDYSKQIYKTITKKQGVDLVIDSVGEKTFPSSTRLLRKGGKYVTCGATTGYNAKIDLRGLFWKQFQIIGSTMGTQQDFRDVMALVFAQKITPVIDRVLPIEQGRDAEQYLQEGKQFGKVLLKIH